jgi:hypothetical protein
MDYQIAVDILKSLESEDTAHSSVTLNMKGIIGEGLSIKSYEGKTDAKKIMDLINLVNSMDPEGLKQQSEQKVAQQAPKKSAANQVFKPFGEKESKKAAKDMHGIVNSLDKGTSPAPALAVVSESSKTLILPELSIQDQINELEKLSIGVDANIFDRSQLAIISTEINGLKDSITGEKKPVEEFQKNLIDLRDKRLSEVISKLKIQS